MFEIEGNAFRAMNDSEKFIRGDILTINKIKVYNGKMTFKTRVHFDCKNQYRQSVTVIESDLEFLQLITI